MSRFFSLKMLNPPLFFNNKRNGANFYIQNAKWIKMGGKNDEWSK